MVGLVPAIHAVRRSARSQVQEQSVKLRFVSTLPWPMLKGGRDRCGMTAWMAGTNPAMTERVAPGNLPRLLSILPNRQKPHGYVDPGNPFKVVPELDWGAR
jgi:hypothetical protein